MNNAIKEKAAEWLVELDTAENIEARWPEFEVWLNENPEHRAAFLRMEQAWDALDELKALHISEDALDTEPIFSQEVKLPIYRRLWRSSLAASIAVAILAGAIAAVWYWYPLEWKHAPAEVAVWQQYETDYGKGAFETLSDGSAIQLNTGTLLRVNLSSTRREAVLERGEVRFDVKHDPARPFVVTAGTDSLQVLGTKFSVFRKAHDTVEAVVEEGRVQITSPSHLPQELAAQQMAVISPLGVRIRTLEPAELRRKVAWTRDELSFEREPLDEVVAQFNLYNREQLQVVDSRIAKLPITGTFAAKNPEAFADQLQYTFDIQHALGGGNGSENRVIQLSGAGQ